jgi:integrase
MDTPKLSPRYRLYIDESGDHTKGRCTFPGDFSYFRYLAERLHVAGKLRETYSLHDLRPSFAVRLYKKNRDVYRVEKALGHATIAVTETYLQSLGLGG